MKIALNLRMDNDLADWVKKQAAAEKRSVANWLDVELNKVRAEKEKGKK